MSVAKVIAILSFTTVVQLYNGRTIVQRYDEMSEPIARI